MDTRQELTRGSKLDLAVIFSIAGLFLLAASIHEWSGGDRLFASAGLAITFLLGLSRPDYTLILSLFAINNPILNFYMLNEKGFGAGQERVIVSAACLSGAAAGIFARSALRRDRRTRSPFDLPIILGAMTICGGAALGILAGNQLREVAAEAYPYLEAAAFYLLASYALTDRSRVRLLLISLLAWFLVCNFWDIAGYFHPGAHYTFLVQTEDGTLLPRLVNFMISLSIPAFFTYLVLFAKDKWLRALLYIGIASGFTILALGSFRSIWIALGFAAIYILSRLKRHGLLQRVLPALLALSLAFGVCSIIISSSPRFGGLSLVDLLKDRFSMRSLYEGSSFYGRLTGYRDIFSQAMAQPFGHGLGAYFSQGAGLHPISSSPSVLLDLLYSLGILGFGAFATCCMSIFLQAVRFERVPDRGTRALSIALAASMLAIFGLENIFPSLLHVPLLAYLAVACSALATDARAALETVTHGAHHDHHR